MAIPPEAVKGTDRLARTIFRRALARSLRPEGDGARALHFKQFYLPSLGHASYLLGSDQTHQAVAIDVRRDVDVYFDAARELELSIAYAADTHQHNDYVTGICELAGRSRAELLASARAELGYGARPLHDGERFELGEVVVEAVATPGHTPEHVSFLVRDRARGDEPVMLLSGGSLLVGDVARPDLLGGAEETREAARTLCRSLREKTLTLPDHVMVFPTHVSGSLCGGNIGSMLFTTIGYERRLNRVLASLTDDEGFAERCVSDGDLPVVPPYWRRMRRQNREGPRRLGVLSEPPPIGPADVARLVDQGAVVLDCRAPEAFAGGHVPGALNVGLGSSFPTWAGTVLPDGARVLLVLDRAADLWDATWELLRIGYELPLGWLAGGMRAWRTQARPIATLPQWTVHELASRLGSGVRVLDVRQPGEWRSGHIEGAVHIPGGELPERVGDVPHDGTLAVTCGSGYRSSVAASLLARHGRTRLVNVLGGMTAWKRAELPTQPG